MVQMIFNRAFSNIQRQGDLLVAFALHKKVNDFLLSDCEI
jgi:hypothetical protein